LKTKEIQNRIESNHSRYQYGPNRIYLKIHPENFPPRSDQQVGNDCGEEADDGEREEQNGFELPVLIEIKKNISYEEAHAHWD